MTHPSIVQRLITDHRPVSGHRSIASRRRASRPGSDDRSRTAAAALTAAAVLALLAGCGSKSKVGDRSLLNFKDQSQQQLGATTTTTAAPPAAGSKAEIGATAPPTTQHPATTAAPVRTTTTAKPAAPTITISINNDNAATKFDPAQVAAKVGTVVVWVNHDNVPRSVVSDDGHTFASPSLPPGGSWSYTTTTAGTFNYHDGTRPYAVAELDITG